MKRWLGPVRPLVHALRSLRDRARHPGLRREASRTVAAVPEVRSVLFLCTGNICRSPYAEKAFARRAEAGGPAGIQVTSAGFLAADRRSPEEAVLVASRRAIQLEGHRSRTVDARMLAGADLVVAMERQHLRRLREVPDRPERPVILLGDLDPIPPDRREIQDPWGHPLEVFERSFDRIDRCLEALQALVRSPIAEVAPPSPPRVDRTP